MSSACSWCNRPNEVHRPINTEGQPDEGSVSLCWGCREPSLFTADGSLRRPNDDEYAEIIADPEVKRIRYAMTEAQRPREAQTMFEEMNRGT